MGYCALVKSTSGNVSDLRRTGTNSHKSDALIGVYSAGSFGVWLKWYLTDNMRINISNFVQSLIIRLFLERTNEQSLYQLRIMRL